MGGINYERSQYSSVCKQWAISPIRVKEKNIFYAEILMDDYAGYISEFTVTSQYVCRYFGIDKVDKDLANMYI